MHDQPHDFSHDPESDLEEAGRPWLFGRLRRSLDLYFTRPGADLDGSDAGLARRALELAEREARLAAAQAELDERARRSAGANDLDPLGPRLARSLDQIDERLGCVLAALGVPADIVEEELAERELRLAGQESELESRRQALDSAVEGERTARLADLEELAAQLAERERELAGRELRLSEESEQDNVDEYDREALRLQARRLSELEATLRERSQELDVREGDLEAREVRLEVDGELREIDLERREREAGELEERLGRQERELGAYVAQVQSELYRREAQLSRAAAA
jgi:hypothetical protein